jgi:uncharacterized protein YigE (DUF2233 family)
MTAAQAAACRDTSFEGASYTVCEVTRARICGCSIPGRMAPMAVSNVDDGAGDRGQTLAFAMNAGMYHRDLAPVGPLCRGRGRGLEACHRAGPGNFGLLPNGVFCIGDGPVPGDRKPPFKEERPDCRFATQSGPMLVIGGKLHPKLCPTATACMSATAWASAPTAAGRSSRSRTTR